MGGILDCLLTVVDDLDGRAGPTAPIDVDPGSR